MSFGWKVGCDGCCLGPVLTPECAVADPAHHPQLLNSHRRLRHYSNFGFVLVVRRAPGSDSKS